MLVLTAISAAIAMNYCEPLGWSLGTWNQSGHLVFLALFGGLIVLGGFAKSIMVTNRYVGLLAGVAAVVFLIVVATYAKMPPETVTGTAYGQAVALVGIFAVTLLCFRAIVDNVVLGTMTFPWQVERVGGAILGFFTGMIVVGVALIAWQLMPFGPGLLTSQYQDFYGLTAAIKKRPATESEASWKRITTRINLSEISQPPQRSWATYSRYNERMKLQATPFPYADGFTLALLRAIGNGSLRGQQTFAHVHQDLLLEAWAGRNGVNPTSYQAVPGDAIFSATWDTNPNPSPGSKANTTSGILSLALRPNAADKDGDLRFKGVQVRLVGTSGQSYWPSGIHLDDKFWAKLYGNLTSLAIPGEDGNKGYLQYKAGYHLWARDAQDTQDQELTRREIRGCQADRLWWQVQMLGETGELELLPGTLAVVRQVNRKEKSTTIRLVFDIDDADQPDYVVFKRTAMKNVTIIQPKPETAEPPASEG